MSEKEELDNILCALICLSLNNYITDICMSIDLIKMNLKQMVSEEKIPQHTEDEFLDIILEAIPTIYRMNKDKSKIIESFEEVIAKHEA